MFFYCFHVCIPCSICKNSSLDDDNDNDSIFQSGNFLWDINNSLSLDARVNLGTYSQCTEAQRKNTGQGIFCTEPLYFGRIFSAEN